MKGEAVHLGDGAYVTRFEDGSYVVTANHHDPDQATDRVYIEPDGMEWLVAFVKGMRGEPVEFI